MREYAMGAVEALHWAVDILEESKNKRQAKREIEDAIRDLMRGVSVDFRDRLRTGNR